MEGHQESHLSYVELRRADGTRIDLTGPYAYQGSVILRWQLPPGAYTLAGQAPDGRRIQGGFVVADAAQTVDVRVTR